MEARVFDGVIMVDGDVTCFDGERETLAMQYNTWW
jgi:hypothetical protein